MNDLFTQCNFTGDQRDVVLTAVRLIHPEFNPETPPPVLNYDCSLLNELNEVNTLENLIHMLIISVNKYKI